VKYSFMTFSCPELTLEEMIAVAKRFGYEGIEPRTSSGHKHGIEFDSSAAFRAECKAKAREASVDLCCVATSCHYADPETTEEMIGDTHEAIELAGDVGAHAIRVFGGPIPEGVSRDRAIESVTEAMKAVADHAAERGVVVCLETHDSWCEPVHLAEVMKRVDHPSIAVNWDIMHPVRSGGATMDEAFETLKPWIRHVHFHDGVVEEDGALTLVPIGEGVVDHRRAVELLQASGYDGYLSGEWINWEPFETHLGRELAAMKRYEHEGA